MHQQSNDFWKTNPWLAVLAAIAIMTGLPIIVLLQLYDGVTRLVSHVFPSISPMDVLLVGPFFMLFVTAVGLWIYGIVYRHRHHRPAGVGDGSGRGSSLPTTR
jgi:membrane protein YdbS with pleckstrin-like domain